MPSTLTQSTATLSKLMSLEPFPLKPNLEEIPKKPKEELENWIRQLEQYIRRLTNKITAVNIQNTLNIEGSTGGFELIKRIIYKYQGDNDLATFDVDTSRDWRKYWFLSYCRMASTVADLDDTSIVTYGSSSNILPGFAADMDVLDDGTIRFVTHIDGSGHITADLANFPLSSQTRYIYLCYYAVAKTPLSAEFTNTIGNGN